MVARTTVHIDFAYAIRLSFLGKKVQDCIICFHCVCFVFESGGYACWVCLLVVLAVVVCRESAALLGSRCAAASVGAGVVDLSLVVLSEVLPDVPVRR